MSTMAADSTDAPADLPTGHAMPRASADDPSPLSKDVLFELLKNQRRRDVLRYLSARDEVVTLSDLAEHVAALENDIPESQLSSQQRKRVYVALYQCHLPILDRANVVEFNQARGRIKRTPRADQLEPYLVEHYPSATRWSTTYLGLAVAGAAAYVLTSLVGALAWLEPVVVLAFIAGIAGLSFVQLSRETNGSPLAVFARRRGATSVEPTSD